MHKRIGLAGLFLASALLMQQLLFTQPVLANVQGCSGQFKLERYSPDTKPDHNLIPNNNFVEGDVLLYVDLFACNSSTSNQALFYWGGETSGSNLLLKSYDGGTITLPEPSGGRIEETSTFLDGRVKTTSVIRNVPIGYNRDNGNIDIFDAQIAQRYYDDNVINEAGQGFDTPLDADSGDGESNEECESSGPLAWIMCPLATNLLEALDNLAGSELQQLLQLNAGVADSPELQEAVDGFRNIANGLLVVGFLFIIFSQAMSLGIDAYTIKRMLPRVVLAAIAIQLSTPVAVILIDIFNVLGVGIAELILSPISDSSWQLNFNPFSSNPENYLTGTFSWLTEGATYGVALAALGSALWALVLAVPTILIVVLITIGMLVIRRLVLVALIILAPLAMAAWVLPNTEKWAKEWFDTFIKVLLMFPLITGIIALGRFMATVSGITTNATPGSPTFIDSIVTLLAAFGPYLLIPFTYQFAGRLFGSLGQMAGRLQGRALGGGGGGASSRGGGAGGGIKGNWQDKMNRRRAKWAAGQTKFTRSDNPFSTYVRRGSAPGMNFPGSKKSRNRADTIARQANRSLVAQGAKELDEQGIAGDKESLRGLSFAVDSAGDRAFKDYMIARGMSADDTRALEAGEVENIRDSNVRKAATAREQWRTRLKDDPALVQAAQLARAQQGDLAGVDDFEYASRGVRGTDELVQNHFNELIGSSMGSGVHQAAGMVRDQNGGVSYDVRAAAGTVASRTGQQLIRTSKSSPTPAHVAQLMQANLFNPQTQQTTVQQVATILTSDEASPALVSQVQNQVYDSAAPHVQQAIDDAMDRIKTGSPPTTPPPPLQGPPAPPPAPPRSGP